MDSWREPSEDQKKVRRRTEGAPLSSNVQADARPESNGLLRSIITSFISSLITAIIVIVLMHDGTKSTLAAMLQAQRRTESQISDVLKMLQHAKDDIKTLDERLKLIEARPASALHQPSTSPSTLIPMPIQKQTQRHN